MKSFKTNLKLLEVAAEGTVQFFATRNIVLNAPALELLNPVLSVTFDRAIILKDKVIVQGTITKNLIFKVATGAVLHQTELIPVSQEINLPGVNPNFVIGKFNRLVLNNNVVNIGPDNQGTQDGIDVQIFVTRLQSFEFLITDTTVDQKIILDFIIKVSKFVQKDVLLPGPPPIFECRNVIQCSNKISIPKKQKKKICFPDFSQVNN